MFQLSGGYTVAPAQGSPSGDPPIPVPLDETLLLARKHYDTIELASDAAASVAFGGVVNAHVISIKTVGGKVRARFTSADGSSQAVPIDSFFLSISNSVPVTSLDLTRVAGSVTTVKVFLGEKSS